MFLANRITYRSPSTELTVADILNGYWFEYLKQYQVTTKQAKVAAAIMTCRTPQLGGRVDQCSECGAWVFQFNSCRDRHCNQCQKYERARWVERQKVLLLPTPYFHVIFTVDHALNPLISQNQREFYNLMFQTVNETLQEFAGQKLGCQLGITAVLHTWGQKLDRHVHIHCIVTGGGLALDGSRWVKLVNGRYLFDIVALSAVYRDSLLAGIRAKYQQGEWELSGPAAAMDVEAVVAELEAKKWEVFAKPFNKPEAVYEYLSRYAHQVAISNYRLVKLEDGEVTFRYYENRERAEVGGKGQEKEMSLPVMEFIRRFMLHILPTGFHRIRYFGLHSSRARKEKLPRVREYLGLDKALPEVEELSLTEWLAEVLGEEADSCPNCGAKGSLFERTTFDELPWLVLILLSLCGQPTTQGVRR
jgi:hypothetical protein